VDARGCGEERGEEEKDTSKLDATRLITVSIIVVMVMVKYGYIQGVTCICKITYSLRLEIQDILVIFKQNKEECMYVQKKMEECMYLSATS
jgi:hypothetical protein